MSLLTTTQPATTSKLSQLTGLVPGLGISALVALAAWQVGSAFPLVGIPVTAILMGLVIGNLFHLHTATTAGVNFSMKVLLQWAIIGLGLKLNLVQLWTLGMASLHITLITLTVAFASAVLLGRLLKLPTSTTIMIGAGTAICGGSAIAAIAPILRPKERELMLALTTIFLFNIAAVVIFPPLGHWLQLTDQGFGLWAGTAINDTSSVVAAAYSFSQQAGDTATIVKLTRASLILPVCLGLSFYMSRRNTNQQKLRWHAVFPLFIVGFVVAAGVHTAGLLPVSWENNLTKLTNFGLAMALAAVGLNSRLSVLVKAGTKPLLLGLAVWVAVATSSLGVQWLSGSW